MEDGYWEGTEYGIHMILSLCRLQVVSSEDS